MEEAARLQHDVNTTLACLDPVAFVAQFPDAERFGVSGRNAQRARRWNSQEAVATDGSSGPDKIRNDECVGAGERAQLEAIIREDEVVRPGVDGPTRVQQHSGSWETRVWSQREAGSSDLLRGREADVDRSEAASTAARENALAKISSAGVVEAHAIKINACRLPRNDERTAVRQHAAGRAVGAVEVEVRMNFKCAAIVEYSAKKQQQTPTGCVHGTAQIFHHAGAHRTVGISAKHERALRRYDYSAGSVESSRAD